MTKSREPLSVVLVYAGFAGLWILASDSILGWLVKDPGAMAIISATKGIAFVGVTSLLLWWLLDRRAGDAKSASAKSRSPFAVALAAALALTALGVWGVLRQQEAIEGARLQAIADLKSQQVADWLADKQLDADFVQHGSLYSDLARAWLAHGDAGSGRQLEAALARLLERPDVSAVSLASPDGRLLWGAGAFPSRYAPEALAAIRKAAQQGRRERIGPYRGQSGRLRLDFAVPLGQAHGSAAVLVLSLDPEKWLFPTLSTWPVPTHSGEIVLFRREGDRVRFLTPLRHRADAPLTLSLPLASLYLPAARVLRGEAKEGQEVRGADYAGHPVLGVVRGIPGSDWFLIAKMDISEVRAQAAKEVAWVALAGLLSFFLFAAFLHLQHQKDRLAAAESVRQAQEQKIEALNLLAAVADSSDDAIFAKDLKGAYLLFNKAASRFVGKSAEDVLGRDDRQIFPPEQAEILMSEDRKALSEQRIQTSDEWLDTTEGRRVFLSTKGPLRDSAGRIVGTFGVCRDVTAAHLAEALVREQKQLLQDMSALAHVGGWHFDPATGHGAWTEEAARIHDLPPDTPINVEAGIGYYAPEDRPLIRAAVRKAIEEGLGYDLELRIITATGRKKWVRTIAHPLVQNRRTVTVRGSIQDISERKDTEARIRSSEERFRRLVEQVPIPLAMVRKDGQITDLNARFRQVLGYTPEDIPTLEAWWLLAYPDPQYRAWVRATWDKAIRDAVETGADITSHEYQVCCKDGTRRWMLISGIMMEDAFLATLFDITARKEAEEALQAQAEQLRANNDELRRFNEASIDREMDMIQLKQLVNEYARRVGEEEPFPLTFLEDEST